VIPGNPHSDSLRWSLPIENSPPGTQTIPTGADSFGRSLFALVGRKPDADESSVGFDEALPSAFLSVFDTAFTDSDFDTVDSDGLVIESMRHANPIAPAMASQGPHVCNRNLVPREFDPASFPWLDDVADRDLCSDGFDMEGSVIQGQYGVTVSPADCALRDKF